MQSNDIHDGVEKNLEACVLAWRGGCAAQRNAANIRACVNGNPRRKNRWRFSYSAHQILQHVVLYDGCCCGTRASAARSLTVAFTWIRLITSSRSSLSSSIMNLDFNLSTVILSIIHTWNSEFGSYVPHMNQQAAQRVTAATNVHTLAIDMERQNSSYRRNFATGARSVCCRASSISQML